MHTINCMSAPRSRTFAIWTQKPVVCLEHIYLMLKCAAARTGDELSASQIIVPMHVVVTRRRKWKRGPREQAPKTRGDGTCALIYINEGQWA
jgi:hypothetical protein